MSDKKKKILIISSISFISLLVIGIFTFVQLNKSDTVSTIIQSAKKEQLKTFQDLKLIEQALEADPEKLGGYGQDITEAEISFLQTLGIDESIISGFRRYTARELITSGFISTFETQAEQEAFLELYGDEEYFVNIEEQIVILKNARDVGDGLTHQKPIDDDSATANDNTYPKFTLVKLGSFKFKLTLKYPDGAVSKQYQINDEEWQDYTSWIMIEENLTVKTRYKLSEGSEYVEGNQKAISELRLTKPTYSFNNTVVKFSTKDKLSGIEFRYSYVFSQDGITESERTEEMVGDSFDINSKADPKEGKYTFTVRTVIPGKTINDSYEQTFAFTYSAETGIVEEVVEKSGNNNISSLRISISDDNFIDLSAEEIQSLNNGETITKNVASNVGSVEISSTPEDAKSVIVGNISYVIPESNQVTIKLKIKAENGDEKVATINIVRDPSNTNVDPTNNDPTSNDPTNNPTTTNGSGIKSGYFEEYVGSSRVGQITISSQEIDQLNRGTTITKVLSSRNVNKISFSGVISENGTNHDVNQTWNIGSSEEYTLEIKDENGMMTIFTIILKKPSSSSGNTPSNTTGNPTNNVSSTTTGNNGKTPITSETIDDTQKNTQNGNSNCPHPAWNYVSKNLSGHTKKCVTCGVTKTEDHSYDSNWKCVWCSYKCECSHPAWNYISKDFTGHTRKCVSCGVTKTENHSYDSNGKCYSCSYEKSQCPHPAWKIINPGTGDTSKQCVTCGYIKYCDHDKKGYKLDVSSNSSTNHTYRCSVNGCTGKYYEPHNYDSTGKCTVCEYYSAELHKHTYGYGGKYNESHHYLKCACGDIKTADHTYNSFSPAGNTSHTKKCSVCGYVTTEGHSLTSYSDYSSTQHKKICKCGYYELASHSYSSGKCICGRSAPSTPATCPHPAWSYSSNTSTSHIKKCVSCGYNKEENHIFDSNNKCYYCSYKKQTTSTSCPHTSYRYSSNGSKGHNKICNMCGKTIATNLSHSWRYITSAGNKNVYECRICGYREQR